MERLVAGDIVVVPFPFTDFSSSRKRPALVLSNTDENDIIICEITSRLRKDKYFVSLDNIDLESGKLRVKSIIRPNRILTIQKNKINYKLGKIKSSKLNEVSEKIKLIFNIA